MQYRVNDESQSPNSFLHTSLCDGIAEISNHLGKDILFWWAAPGANYMAGFQLWISGRPSWVKRGEGRARGMFIVNQSFLSTKFENQSHGIEKEEVSGIWGVEKLWLRNENQKSRAVALPVRARLCSASTVASSGLGGRKLRAEILGTGRKYTCECRDYVWNASSAPLSPRASPRGVCRGQIAIWLPIWFFA